LMFDGPPAALTEAVVVNLFGEAPTGAPASRPIALGEAIWVNS
jgi:hypothetical protein